MSLRTKKMSLLVAAGSGSAKQSRRRLSFIGAIGGAASVSAFLLLLFNLRFFFNSHIGKPHMVEFSSKWRGPRIPCCLPAEQPLTNLSHVVFGLVGSTRTWRKRREILQAWWRPGVTRGYLFLDKYPDESLLCPATCPPVRVNEDITGWEIYPKIKFPIQVRIMRSIIEAFRERDQNVRWYVFADDDSVLFVDNIVDVLSKYDHTKYVYIGSSGAESIRSNTWLSFDMGYGGAGFALSYPLVAALSKKLDGCIKRYPHLPSADYFTYVCITDLGVALSPQKGFHQIDFKGDISGFLSAHSQSPLLSLHHINIINPIFPNMTRLESIRHLMKPANIDQTRILQQFICYHHPKKWSFSISWGYSANLYENVISRNELRRPIQTFSPWNENQTPPGFMFNTRGVRNSSCETPRVFFFDSVEVGNIGDTKIVTTSYIRSRHRGLEACSVSGIHSADGVNKIHVFSSVKRAVEAGKTECCDVAMVDEETATVKLRACMEAEEIV